MIGSKGLDVHSPQFKQKAMLVFLWLSLAIGLLLLRSVLLPFLLASLFAYVCHPIVALLGKLKVRSHPIPKPVSVILIYLFLAGIMTVIGVFFIPQLYTELVRLAKELTALINSVDENTIARLGQRIEEFFRAYRLPVEIVAPAMDGDKVPVADGRQNWISIDLLKISHNILNDIIIYIKSETRNIIISAQTVFAKLVSILFMSLLIIMITGFLLVDVDRIKGFVFSLVPVGDRASFDVFLKNLDQRLSGVVRGQLNICCVNAVLTLIGLLIFKVKFALVLATIAGIFSLVPIFGSIASTIPIVLVALTASPLKALFALLWIIGIHILEANFLNPKIMGNSAKMHPILIVLTLVAGEHYYGIVGALLGVPIASILVTIFMSFLAKAKLMGQGVANPVEGDTIATKEV